MQKQIIKADVPETGGPFNLCVRHGDMIYVSGLPPFDAEFSGKLKAARANKQPIPAFPDIPFEQQVRIVMDHLKKLVEAAGSNMDCLLKVIVWLKDQRQQEEFDRIYRSYFSSQETLPARTRMQAGRTPLDCGLEVEAIGFAVGSSVMPRSIRERFLSRAIHMLRSFPRKRKPRSDWLRGLWHWVVPACAGTNARRALATLLFLSLASVAQAQSNWPDRPIKFVVHVAAGGGFDLMARILADRLSRQLPQPIVVENNGSGAGVVAARMVAHAEPDGYTFLFVGPGFASVPFLHKQPPYDPAKDFVPVSLVTRFPQLLVIKPSLPAKDLKEFIALARSEPGKLTFGSSGVGGAAHLPAELFMHLAGVKMVHVPFRGGGPASAALLGAQIDMLFDGIAPQQGNIDAGRVRALGVTTKERSPLLPDMPAIAETVPGFQFPLWTGLFAPAKTPKDIVDRLAAEIGRAMHDPATRKRYNDVKLEAIGSSPGDFDTFFREQLKFNEDVIKRANIQQE